MQCFIVRHRGGGGSRLYPRYSLFLDVGHKFLAAARKRKKSKASMYVMSLDEKVRRSSLKHLQALSMDVQFVEKLGADCCALRSSGGAQAWSKCSQPLFCSSAAVMSLWQDD